MKRATALLLALLMLAAPLAALAELEYSRQPSRYIDFPTLDKMRAYFYRNDSWTIVTRDNLNENIHLMLERGENEEDVRARFAEDTLLFEAYSPELPQGACFRAERYTNALTREAWHAKYLDKEAREELCTMIELGFMLDRYDVFSLASAASGDDCYLLASYTSYPPATPEAGVMQLRFHNGTMYVFTCGIYGQLRISAEERTQLTFRSPMDDTTFGTPVLPILTPFMLDGEMPVQVDMGEITVTGSIRAGGQLTAALDGKPLDVSLDGQGRFSTVVPLISQGDHEVTFTATHQKHTTREETYTINVSANRTPLNLSQYPAGYVKAGKMTIAGTTDPDAALTLQLDKGENITLDVDENGAFSHELHVPDSNLHYLRLAAIAPDKDLAALELPFLTLYETSMDGLNAFMKKINTTDIAVMAQSPDDYAGERVKTEVQVKEVIVTETGLGFLCQPYATRNEDLPLYVTVYGYLHGAISAGNIITVYGTVEGTELVEGESEPRLNIVMQYATYTAR